jgi:hypothetical protein
MKLVHALGDPAVSPGGVGRASFVAGAVRELSIGLCGGNFFMYHACLGMLAKSGGTGFRAGMRVPTDEQGLLENSCLCYLYFCAVLTVCPCAVLVAFWVASVNALAGCGWVLGGFLCVCKYVP